MSKGAKSYLKGLAAEQTVADFYCAKGYNLKAVRKKTAYGEIDLILEKEDEWVFVEVKASKNFAQAAQRITPVQIQRIVNAASEYLANLNLLDRVNCRFDAGLVDAQGRVQIIPNAFQ